MINLKYGGWRDLDSEGRRSKESWWWQDLSKLCGADEHDSRFKETTEWKAGNGMGISFWHDKWIGEEKLCEEASRLFCNSVQQNAKIGEMGEWKLAWCRPWFAWEQQLLQQLLQTLQ